MMKLVLALVALVATIGIAFGTPSQVGFVENPTVFEGVLDVIQMSQLMEDNDKQAFIVAIEDAVARGTVKQLEGTYKIYIVDNQFAQYYGFQAVRFQGNPNTVYVYPEDIRFE